MNVSEVEIDSVIPYINNPRNNEAAIDKVAGSIAEFGWQQPIVIDHDNVVIVGHTRLLAARKLGLARVPVVIADHLSPAQVKAYRIADNRVHEDSSWDVSMLAVELEDLDTGEIDLSVLGFEPDELERYLVRNINETDFPQLPDGEKPEFEQITFHLHKDQAAVVREAVQRAKDCGLYDDSVNDNANGNALHYVCAQYLSGDE